MATTAIRDYLRTKGLSDNDITYDNGAVLAKGKRFIDATPQSDGRTYADPKALENAYNAYDTSNQIEQLRSRATTPNSELSSLQQSIRDRVSKPVQQFSYDAQSDPQYQAAIRQAQQNAQTAGNNTMVALGSKGIGNSTITSDRVAQIQQKELGNVTDNVLPQLISQAYQRFQGQQQAENNQTGQLMQLANMYDNQDQQQYARLAQALGLQNGYNQQQFQNDRAMTQEQRQAQQDHLALASQLSQQYGVNVDPKDDPALAYAQVKGLTPLAMQQFMQQKEAQDAGFTGMYKGQDTEQKLARLFSQDSENRRIGLQAQGQAQSAENARNSNALAWARLNNDMDPNNLDNLYKKAQIDSLTNKNNKVDMQKELQGLTSSLRSGDLTPSSALQQLEEDFSMGFYTKPQYDQLKSTITKLAPTYTKEPTLTKEQQDQMPSAVQLDNLVPAGVPELDWKSWYQDPKGRSAGLSFERWQQLYGPRIG